MTQENTTCFKSEPIRTFTEKGFQPIIELFCSVLNTCELEPINFLENKPVQVFHDGVDHPPFMFGFGRVNKMEKCEKVTLSNFIMMDRIMACAVTIVPAEEYALPMLVLEWSETENIISVLVDFIPPVDIVMEPGYREKYLDPLDDCWMKYKDLPGMSPNRFSWTRQLMGPYSLCGHISKETEENKALCLQIFKDYLECWMKLWQEAEPVADPQLKEKIKERRSTIRKVFRDNDEGAKTMRQIIGTETVDLILLCNF
ncbi:MAG: hypothetical protein JW832_00540 [Deltaproteobacteria bacterium]|nr:hypothetical protein [Deltaproteobacteria bacterium]